MNVKLLLLCMIMAHMAVGNHLGKTFLPRSSFPIVSGGFGSSVFATRNFAIVTSPKSLSFNSLVSSGTVLFSYFNQTGNPYTFDPNLIMYADSVIPEPGQKICKVADASTVGNVLACSNDIFPNGLGGVDIFQNQVTPYVSITRYTLRPDGITRLDLYGFAIAVSGNGTYILVGAPGKSGSGVAYFYAFDGMSIRELSIISPSLAMITSFGRSVALSGSGAKVAIGGYSNTSTYYFYAHNTSDNTITSIASISEGHALGSEFGSSFCHSDEFEVIAIGASGRLNGTGGVFVYKGNGTGYALQELIHPSVIVPGDQFGSDCSMTASGSVLLISAAGNETVFQMRDIGSGYTLNGTIQSSTSSSSSFGRSVSIHPDGESAMVGAPTFQATGAASYYLCENDTLSEVSLLLGNDSTGLNVFHFGDSVAATGDFQRVVAAAPLKGNGSANIYVYSVSLTFDAKSSIPLSAEFDLTHEFVGDLMSGAKESLMVLAKGTGKLLAVGVPSLELVYLYEEDGSSFVEKDIVRAVTGTNGSFGAAIALTYSGDRLVVGSPYALGVGVVSVYRIDNGVATTIQTITETEGDMFGLGVDISANGDTLLASVSGINGTVGMRYYELSDSAFGLVDTYYGKGRGKYVQVGLSGDGNIAAIVNYKDGSITAYNVTYVRSPSSRGPSDLRVCTDIDATQVGSIDISFNGSTIAVGCPEQSSDSSAAVGEVEVILLLNNSASVDTIDNPESFQGSFFGNSVAVSDKGGLVLTGSRFATNTPEDAPSFVSGAATMHAVELPAPSSASPLFNWFTYF